MSQQNTTGTVYGVPVSEWMTYNRDQMRNAKRKHEDDTRRRNREGTARRMAQVEAENNARLDAKRKAEDEAQHERLVNQLRHGYFASDRAATEADFDAALPTLIEKHRQESALSQRNHMKATLRRNMSF